MKRARFIFLGIAAATVASAACAGEPTPTVIQEPEPEADTERTGVPEADEAPEPTTPQTTTPQTTTEDEAEPEDLEPDFDAALPADACPDVVVRIAHRDGTDLPPVLSEAIAFRSEDGRHVRITLADTPLTLPDDGRFLDPQSGHARFEMDAVRSRRGRLAPRVLGTADSSRGGLTHARIVATDARFNFGARQIGRVELTEVTDERICGVIDLDDGFGRVRGGFTAPVVGPLPD